MKKLLAFALLAVFLSGCILESPWGEFRARPDEAVLEELEELDETESAVSEAEALDGIDGSILYLEPGAGSFRFWIDGETYTYDQIGVVLRPGETADPENWADLFMGDYPASSPRDVVIKSRVKMGERSLESWRAQTASGNLERKSFIIEIWDDQRTVISRVYFHRTWPSEYAISVMPTAFEETVVLSVEAVEIEEY
ncbi:MAG TPA: hypothetical protein VJH24_04025 [Candidatus Bilamarchaeaceae archaeon]|nr:hypothetical protein [Candidatus Bilamarchaeaceae archaeon]